MQDPAQQAPESTAPEIVVDCTASRSFHDSPPRVSLILPTYNRRENLRTLLEALEGQTGIASDDFELCIGDDGSRDGSLDMVRDWNQNHSLRIRYSFSRENRGPASARNHACALARGDIWIIIGDDIEPPPDFLFRHLEWHRAHPEPEAALLGRVVWPEKPEPTEFMRWLEQQGREFYFTYPDGSGEVSPERFYTCNVSLKRVLAQRCQGFREDFRYASHEDLEYGIRLAEEGGMRLYYDPGVLAVHRHELTPGGTVRRVYLNGRSSVLFWKIVPDYSSAPKKLFRPVVRVLVGWVPVGWLQKHADAVPAFAWYPLLFLAYWSGVSDEFKS